MKPHLIIFDFDGTLADTAANILASYEITIKENGFPERSVDQYRATIGIPLKEGFRQLYPEFSDEQLNNCVSEYRRIFSSIKSNYPPSLYPGVKEGLISLKKMGIVLSIASSRSRSSLLEMCEILGIEGFFSLILGSEDVSLAKPNPEPVLKSLELLKIDNSEAIVVGDMPYDIMMGKRAECQTVGVTYGNSTRRVLINSGAEYIIDSFSELIPHVIFEK